MATSSSPRIAIIGAGIIGLACGLELLRRGARVTIFDGSEPGRGSSWAAAGMLAPAYESLTEEEVHPRLAELCYASAALWPDFARRLAKESGMDVHYRSGPTLAVAFDEDRARALETIGQPVTLANIRAQEPAISRDIVSGVRLAGDGRVDNRQAIGALVAAVTLAGGVFERRWIDLDAPDIPDHDAVLIAAGAGATRQIAPVTGVMLAFDRRDIPIEHAIRCEGEYAVPRGDQVLIGATIGPVADPRAFLLERALRFLPRLRQARLVDQWEGQRPDSPDHAPFIGALRRPGHFLAGGHYRNGILLAPITARLIADAIFDEPPTALGRTFAPDRLSNIPN